jgi:hypothetical protein
MFWRVCLLRLDAQGYGIAEFVRNFLGYEKYLVFFLFYRNVIGARKIELLESYQCFCD